MREELARIIERLQDAGADSEAIADDVLASPVITALQSQAWDLGFNAGQRYARQR